MKLDRLSPLRDACEVRFDAIELLVEGDVVGKGFRRCLILQPD